jgi:CBS domain containing-hemolysin-like protein
MDELPGICLCLVFAEGDAAVSYSVGSIIIKLLSVVLLVAANGFFVAAEFALVGVRASRIETLAATGSRPAKRVLELLKNLNAYLSACQLGITLASLALGWIGEPAIARLLEGPLSKLSQIVSNPETAEALRHGIAFAIAFSIITSLHIVLGEQAPKLLGLAAAEKTALAVALPLQIFYRIASWPVRALDWASVRTVQLMGVKAVAEHASTYTEEELRRLVEKSRESGHLRAEEGIFSPNRFPLRVACYESRRSTKLDPQRRRRNVRHSPLGSRLLHDRGRRSRVGTPDAQARALARLEQPDR